ncbi:hypothetical protein DFJ73DRAFT_130541 [Zopfochytrium polystomum]|nr:hypothetical protein DFJ73DRAFT_130541 [Zopfochytrium polystomum]
MHWDELAFFAGPSNLIVVAASSFILARYRTNAAAFDLSQPSHLYCEWSSQGYLWADLALAACAVVACVCILLPHYVPSAPSWLMDGLIDEAVRIGVLCIGKLVLTVIGLAFAFPAGFNHCKSGDFVLWVYCAFRIG